MGCSGVCSSHANKAPPNTKPVKNAQRQALPFSPIKAAEAMPLMPVTLPKAASTSQLAKPIKTPPTKGLINAAIHVSMLFLLHTNQNMNILQGVYFC